MEDGSYSQNMIQMPGFYQRLAWNSPFIRGVNSIAMGIGHYTKPAMNRAFLWSSWHNRMSNRTGPWPGSVHTDKVYTVNPGEDMVEKADEDRIKANGKTTRVKGTVKTYAGSAEAGPVITPSVQSLKLSLLMPFKPVNKGSGKQIDELKSQIAYGNLADNVSWKEDIGGLPQPFKVRIPGQVKPRETGINLYPSRNETLADGQGFDEAEKTVRNVKEAEACENILLSKVNQADELLMFRPSREELYQRIKKQNGEAFNSRKLDMVNELGIAAPDSNGHTEKRDMETQKPTEPVIKPVINKASIYPNEKVETVYRVKGKSQKAGQKFKTLSDAMVGLKEYVEFKPAINLATRGNRRLDDGETPDNVYAAVPVLQDLAYGRQLLNKSSNGFEPSLFEAVNQPNRREVPASSFANQAVNVKVVGKDPNENEYFQPKNDIQGWTAPVTEQHDMPDAGNNSFLPYTEAISDQVFERMLEMVGHSDGGRADTPHLAEDHQNRNDKGTGNNIAGREERSDGGIPHLRPMTEPEWDVGLIVDEVYKRVNSMDQTEKERKGLY